MAEGRLDVGDCLTDDLIENYLRHRLDEDAEDSVEAHICFCSSCLQALEQERLFQESMREAAVRLEKHDADRKKRAINKPIWASALFSGHHRWRWAAAAAFCIAVFVLFPRAPSDLESVTLSTYRSSAPAPTATAGAPLLLKVDLRGIELARPVVLEVVSSTGETLQLKRFDVVSHELLWSLRSGLPRGGYWVRAHRDDTARTLLREFALQIR